MVDNLMLAFRRRPFRCRFCECRFYRSSTLDTVPEPVETVSPESVRENKSA
jgi:hypothetical protein